MFYINLILFIFRELFSDLYHTGFKLLPIKGLYKNNPILESFLSFEKHFTLRRVYAIFGPHGAPLSEYFGIYYNTIMAQ